MRRIDFPRLPNYVYDDWRTPRRAPRSGRFIAAPTRGMALRVVGEGWKRFRPPTARVQGEMGQRTR